jgi:hypothetical protein
MKRPGREMKGPALGCPIPEPHPWRYCRKCHNAYMRTAREKGKWPWEYNLKSRARAISSVYLNRGKLKKEETCFQCGLPSQEKHHPDYTKPLDVVWMCRKCHWALHRIEAKNSPKKTTPEVKFDPNKSYRKCGRTYIDVSFSKETQ